MRTVLYSFFDHMKNYDEKQRFVVSDEKETVQSLLAKRLDPKNIHIGPSDFVPWQKGNEVCFMKMEGKLFGDIPMNIELRLSVEA